MVNDAKLYEEQDNVWRKQIEAWNSLENYVYHIRNSLDEPNLKDKFTPSDISSINSKCEEVANWLHSNPELSADEMDARQKEIEKIFNPIMQRVYQAGTRGGAPDVNMGEAPTASAGGSNDMDLD